MATADLVRSCAGQGDTHRGLAGDDRLVLVTQGCREDEQNRPLTYDKGVYRGQLDQALDDQQVARLRQRSAVQKF